MHNKFNIIDIHFMNFYISFIHSYMATRGARLPMIVEEPVMVSALSCLLTFSLGLDDKTGDITEFRLPNGLKVILIRKTDHPVAVVALGVHAGVWDEPEGCCGLAHLAEHLFCYGATKNYPAYRAFELLSRDGPLGIPFQDANAETMWGLTYFYSARPTSGVPQALEVFAEKLQGITATPQIVEDERQKVLMEIDHATQMMKKHSGLKLPFRYPKAGIASHAKSIQPWQIEAFLSSNYRPDRMTLLVMGSFDPAEIRTQIERHYGPLQLLAEKKIKERIIQDVPVQVIASFDCSQSTVRQRAALKLLGVVWETELRKQGKAHIEMTGARIVRFALQDATPDLFPSTLVHLKEKTTKESISQGREQLRSRTKMQQMALVQADQFKAKDQKQYVRTMMQAAIWRLQFEAEGGQESLDQLSQLTDDEVLALGQQFLVRKPTHLQWVKP